MLLLYCYKYDLVTGSRRVIRLAQGSLNDLSGVIQVRLARTMRFPVPGLQIDPAPDFSASAAS